MSHLRDFGSNANSTGEAATETTTLDCGCAGKYEVDFDGRKEHLVTTWLGISLPTVSCH
jgi:hypothetical protein